MTLNEPENSPDSAEVLGKCLRTTIIRKVRAELFRGSPQDVRYRLQVLYEQDILAGGTRRHGEEFIKRLE